MKNLTEIEVKQIEKFKKNVQKQYPGAFLRKIGSGYYTVASEQADLTIKDILAEMLFLPVHDPVEAWRLASTIAKTTQNLNRTHPTRLEGMEMEDKIARMAARAASREMSKNKSVNEREFDNY